jgi:hypothetical protein
MKEQFFGYYDPIAEEVDQIWDQGIFVFDANALLNFYRYSQRTRADFLTSLSKLKEKLFMPFQVGFEFHSNRHLIIDNLGKSYDSLLSGVKEVFDKTVRSMLKQYLRHPSIDIELILKLGDDFLKRIEKELAQQSKSHPNYTANDEVLSTLTELYINKVGPALSKDALKKIYDEGKERYEQEIPPGYRDIESKRKKGQQHVYGDLIIWKQIISHAIKEKKPVVFVTDDRKDDWWAIEKGKTIRPRPELVKEFYDLTGLRILIYNADTFLHFAKERKLAAKIKESSIVEVQEIRKSDEKFIDLTDSFKATLKLGAANIGVSGPFSKNGFIPEPPPGLLLTDSLSAIVRRILQEQEDEGKGVVRLPIVLKEKPADTSSSSRKNTAEDKSSNGDNDDPPKNEGKTT